VTPAATPLTAALAGIFSGLTWPILWPLVSGPGSLDGIWLLLGTIGLIGLPAHAFVVGFKRTPSAGAARVDTGLLVRVAVWLAGAVGAALIVSALRASA
jgi:hypothetical protein